MWRKQTSDDGRVAWGWGKEKGKYIVAFYINVGGNKNNNNVLEKGEMEAWKRIQHQVAFTIYLLLTIF